MLKAKNIHKTYYNGSKKLEVLKGVDLEVEKGKFLAIVGPSGAGKSTLLHILGGLDSPTEGSVTLAGDDLYHFSDQKLAFLRNKKIGFVFQFYHLLSEFTVLENVFLPAYIRCPFARSPVRPLENRARQLLKNVGLSERVDYFPNQLSGGEKQRVAIARALINDPEFFFCDEPTGNLDSETGNHIIALIKELSVQNQMSVVLVTHNLEIAKMANRVYHLRDGILVN